MEAISRDLIFLAANLDSKYERKGALLGYDVQQSRIYVFSLNLAHSICLARAV